MATPFSDIYDIFSSLITDYDMADLMTQEEAEDMLLKYMKMTISLDFKRCKKNLKDTDITLKQFNEDLDEEEKTIIAMGMIKYWISPKIIHEENLKQHLGDRDYKVLHSGANFLDKLLLLKTTIKSDLQSYLNSYHYNNFNGYKNR